MLSKAPDFDPIFRQFDFDSRRAVVAALSGGSDSTALLLLLQRYLIRAAPHVRLFAVTIDHRLRAGSTAEAAQVARFCAGYGIDHHISTWLEAKPATGLPEAARLARYRLLADTAGSLGADMVLTGHTLDDQIETVRMRRLRGSGRGLAGMAPATLFDGRCWIARPLLGTCRDALRAILAEDGIGWIDDPTNRDSRFERPRLRAAAHDDEDEILDLLAKAGQARRRLGLDAARAIDAHADLPSPGLIRLDRAFVAQLEQPGALYALRILLAVAGGSAHLPDEESATTLAGRLAEGRLRATLSRCIADLRTSGLYLLRERRDMPALVLKGETSVWDGRFRLSGLAGSVARAAQDGEFAKGPTANGVPDSLAKAALATLPVVEGEQGHGATRPEFVPLLAPWNLFLPDFDLAPARAVARLIGAPSPPASPFTGHKDISA